MEKHLDHLERKRKKIFDHLIAIHQPERMSVQALDNVAELIIQGYPIIKSLGVDLFSYDCPEKLYDEVSAKVRKHRRQQRIRRFLPTGYKEADGGWGKEAAYWLDQLIQGEPSKKGVRELQEKLIETKSPKELVNTLKSTINNDFDGGDFPPINDTSLQKVYQDDQWMLMEAWSARDIDSLLRKTRHVRDIRLLLSNRRRITETELFNECTFKDFARCYVLCRKKTEGVEVIVFHMKDDQGVARIKHAFDARNGYCEDHLAKVLESAPARLRDSLRGFAEEDIYQSPEFWMPYIEMDNYNIRVSEDIYKKEMNQWVDGSHPKWGVLDNDEKMHFSQNLLFWAEQHRDIDGFLSVVMKAGTIHNFRKPEWNNLSFERWKERMVRWYLSDNNPPAVSGEVIKRFVKTAGSDLMIHFGFINLLLVASRFAADVTVKELLVLAQDRDKGLESVLESRVFRGFPILLKGEDKGKKLSRPDWVKSALNKLLDYVPDFGDDYLMNVLGLEKRWLGNELLHDAQYNQRLLSLCEGVEKRLQAQSGRLLGSWSLIKYKALLSRLLEFPDGARLMRSRCREESNNDWIWRVSQLFHGSDIMVLFSEPMLDPESLNQLIAEVPDRLSDRNISNHRTWLADLTLSLIFEKAERSLSTPGESLLSALCGENAADSVMSRTLGLMIRDKSVRFDKGRGWEQRLNCMKMNPKMLLELLKSNRLSLDGSDKNELKHDEFIKALLECNSNCSQYEKVKISDLIDAYVDSFGVAALQNILDVTREWKLFDRLFDEELVQHIHEKTRVKEPSCSSAPSLD